MFTEYSFFHFQNGDAAIAFSVKAQSIGSNSRIFLEITPKTCFQSTGSLSVNHGHRFKSGQDNVVQILIHHKPGIVAKKCRSPVPTLQQKKTKLSFRLCRRCFILDDTSIPHQPPFVVPFFSHLSRAKSQCVHGAPYS